MSLHPPAAVRVKICGLTNREDALAAIALGADALGFNFFARSKRFLDLEQNAAWMCALPPLVTRVAVLVNVPLEEARRIARHPAIDMVQFHGDEEDATYCAEFARLGRPFIKALRIAGEADIEGAADFSTDHVLIDAHVPGAYGGTGRPIDFALAAELVVRQPKLHVLLAGGLHAGNIVEAVRAVRPYAVDVASGVEKSDAREKDFERMREFIGAAKFGGAM